MAMALAHLLNAEVASGLSRVRGGRVSVQVPIRQHVVDELLRVLPGMPPDVAVTLGDAGRLQVRYGLFHANARLHPAARLTPAPVVTVELASQMLAWALQRAPLPPFIQVSGRLVHVHLARVPELERAAPLWPHVEHLAISSIRGQLDVRLSLHVAQGRGQ
jgi:hypothetical protein